MGWGKEGWRMRSLWSFRYEVREERENMTFFSTELGMRLKELPLMKQKKRYGSVFILRIALAGADLWLIGLACWSWGGWNKATSRMRNVRKNGSIRSTGDMGRGEENFSLCSVIELQMRREFTFVRDVEVMKVFR